MLAREDQLQAELDRARVLISQKDRIIQIKDEQIRLLYLKFFGPKSEKLSTQQQQLLLAEIGVHAEEVNQEADLPQEKKDNPEPRPRRQPHPGRNPLPEHLERREKVIPCHPADCTCDVCGAERPVIGYEVSEKLCCEPARFYVEVTKLEKRGSHCQDEQGVATAPVPPAIVPKGKLSNGFIIEALSKKFQLHQPIYRQCAELWNNHQIELSIETLNEGVLACGALLMAVTSAMRQELIVGSYIQADETPVPCQTREKKGRNHKAYAWEYSRPGGVVIFDFQMSRGREGPKAFLKGFRGKLQVDGYGAYDDLGEGITYVACMAHMRRKFVEFGKVAPNDPVAPEIIERITKIYAIEKEAREAGLDATRRLALRQQKTVPLMAALKGRIVEVRRSIAPGGKLAQACDYALGQWGRLEEILKDGQVEIDNNWCEGAIRPIALGRKNWLHIGSEEAGAKIAAICSIVETCRRLEINLKDYLSDILPKLGDWPINRVSQLTPSAWKAAQSAHS